MAEKKTGPSPVDRSKRGAKRSVLIEGHGVPVGVATAGANVNDFKLLGETLSSPPVPRPEPTPEDPQNLCLDKGYAFDVVRQLVFLMHFVGHIRPIGEEPSAAKNPRDPPRRWKVERTGSWFNRFRGLLIRWSKKPENHDALLEWASGWIALRMAYAQADCQFG